MQARNTLFLLLVLFSFVPASFAVTPLICNNMWQEKSPRILRERTSVVIALAGALISADGTLEDRAYRLANIAMGEAGVSELGVNFSYNESSVIGPLVTGEIRISGYPDDIARFVKAFGELQGSLVVPKLIN